MRTTPTPEDPPILTKVEQEHCWVCHKRFIECGGTDPAVVRNRHHVVPQANGGKDGPTVTLCSAHHDMLHAIAVQRLANKPIDTLLGSMLYSSRARVLYLADVVVRSTLAVADDPNKRGQLAMTLTGEEHRMLKRLAKDSKLSEVKTVKALIKQEYLKRYPTIQAK